MDRKGIGMKNEMDRTARNTCVCVCALTWMGKWTVCERGWKGGSETELEISELAEAEPRQVWWVAEKPFLKSFNKTQET